MRRGVQIMGWSVRMALIAWFTQYSGFRGGRNDAISFLILQPWNMPVSTRKGHTSVILIPSFSAAFSSWLSDSWKPMAPNLLAQ
uniref:Secreted protein n=1 Tax=Anguilla anguilla TaxID=7936 RepID=A0A0E9SZC1_ANGAN